MTRTPTLRTGRLTTFIVSVMAVLMMAYLGLAQFLGHTAGMTLTVLESLALLVGSVALLAEIYFEGNRTGLFTRKELTGLDIFGSIAAAGVLTMGLLGLVGATTGETLVAMPTSVKGGIFVFNAILLMQELFSE